jgi:hypothetical protein
LFLPGALLPVVVPCTPEEDAAGADAVLHAILFGDSSGPASLQSILQRFRLAESGERVADYVIYKPHDSQGDSGIEPDPVRQVMPEVTM